MVGLDTIPIINISPFLEGSLEDKQRVAKQVTAACESIGFLIIVGHGVPQSLIDQTYAVSKQFFDLPIEQKLKVVPLRLDVFCGYTPITGDTLARTLEEKSPGDLREIYEISRVDTPKEDYFHTPAASAFFSPNIWPDAPKDFQTIWVEYYRTMETLASQLMRIFAVALNLPEYFFEDKIDKHFSTLAAINYPDQPEEPLPGQLRGGAHTDFGSFTILYQDEALGGLQVLTQANQWIDVRPIPGSFVINLGDLIARWTNDRWVSTLHRVINPPRVSAPDQRHRSSGHRRQSLAFFHKPNYDALITCLAGCCSPDNPPKYAPITSGKHLSIKMMKMRTGTAATGNRLPSYGSLT